MGIHDLVGDAEVTNRGVYFIEGTYRVLQVEQIFEMVSQNDDDLVIIECAILQSDVKDRPAGSRVSQVYNFRYKSTPGNVRAMLAAVFAVPVEEITPEVSMLACSQEQPCAGRLVRVEAKLGETRAGNPFTFVSWKPLRDDMQLQAAELREAAGFEPL